MGYRRALEVALGERGLHFEREVQVPIAYGCLKTRAVQAHGARHGSTPQRPAVGEGHAEGVAFRLEAFDRPALSPSMAGV